MAKRREERKDDSLPRNLPIIILIKNIYEEKTDDFAATPALEAGQLIAFSERLKHAQKETTDRNWKEREEQRRRSAKAASTVTALSGDIEEFLTSRYDFRYNLLTDENLAIVDELSKVADDLGTNVAILSLAWILKHPEISCVIAGASKPSQLENNLKAVDLEIPDDAMERIEKILGFQRFERHVG